MLHITFNDSFLTTEEPSIAAASLTTACDGDASAWQDQLPSQADGRFVLTLPIALTNSLQNALNSDVHVHIFATTTVDDLQDAYEQYARHYTFDELEAALQIFDSEGAGGMEDDTTDLKSCVFVLDHLVELAHERGKVGIN